MVILWMVQEITNVGTLTFIGVSSLLMTLYPIWKSSDSGFLDSIFFIYLHFNIAPTTLVCVFFQLGMLPHHNSLLFKSVGILGLQGEETAGNNKSWMLCNQRVVSKWLLFYDCHNSSKTTSWQLVCWFFFKPRCCVINRSVNLLSVYNMVVICHIDLCYGNEFCCTW